MPGKTSSFEEDVYLSLRNYFQNLLHPDVIDQVPIQWKRKFRDEDYAKRPYHDTIVPNREAVRSMVLRFDFFEGYDEVAEELKSWSDYETGSTPESVAIDDTVGEFFEEMINRSPAIGIFDQETFDDVFQELMRFHSADEIPMRAWTYLYGFQMPVEEIDIDRRFTIREMNAGERESIHEKLRDKSTQWPIRRDDVFQEYIVEYQFTQDNSDILVSRHDHAQEQIDRLLTAVRLFHSDGTVNHGHLFIEPVWEYVEGARGMNAIKRRKYGGRESCEFTPGECDRFPEFLHKVERDIKTESDGKFTSPLTRLNESHEKYSHEDRVLSCAIGFENLIMSGEKSGSYSFRLQLRPSILLKNIVCESTEEVRDFFKTVYWARGEIVHNDREIIDIMQDEDFKMDTKNYSPSEFVNDCQYFLGAVIRTYMLFEVVSDIPVRKLNRLIEDAAFSAELVESPEY